MFIIIHSLSGGIPFSRKSASTATIIILCEVALATLSIMESNQHGLLMGGLAGEGGAILLDGFLSIYLRCKSKVQIPKNLITQGEIPQERDPYKVLKSQWTDIDQSNPDRESIGLELIRLRKTVLTKAVEDRIDENILQRYHTGEDINRALSNRVKKRISETANWDDLAKINIGRALEIRELYKDTHYILTHAQRSDLIMITYLIKEIQRLKLPKEELKRFKPLYFPSSENNERMEVLTKLLSENAFGNKEEQGENDHRFNDLLISCDLNFWNDEVGESTIDFFLQNRNVVTGKQSGINILKKIARNAGISQEKINEIEEVATQPQHFLLDELSPFGNFFLICIPKNKDLNEFGYLALPYGKKKKDHDLGSILKESPDVQGNHQFRLYREKLVPGEGIKVMAITAIPKSIRKNLKKRFKQILTDASSE